MPFTLRRNETASWLDWTDNRYRVVSAKHRSGAHLTRPGSAVTLCMRRADRSRRADQDRLCGGCRSTAMVAYLMAHPAVSVG